MHAIFPFRRSLMLLVLGLVLAASARADSAARPLKVGYLPVTGHAKFFVAKEQGLFAQEGLDVELIEFVNSADGLNAVIAGKLDITAYIDTQLYQQALDRLAAEEPGEPFWKQRQRDFQQRDVL